MTRKEELESTAIEMESDLGLPDTYREYFLAKLLQVEREVWGKVAEHCRCMHNDGYTLNDVLGCGNEGDIIVGACNDELRTIERWALDQQKELG